MSGRPGAERACSSPSRVRLYFRSCGPFQSSFEEQFVSRGAGSKAALDPRGVRRRTAGFRGRGGSQNGCAPVQLLLTADVDFAFLNQTFSIKFYDSVSFTTLSCDLWLAG